MEAGISSPSLGCSRCCSLACGLPWPCSGSFSDERRGIVDPRGEREGPGSPAHVHPAKRRNRIRAKAQLSRGTLEVARPATRAGTLQVLAVAAPAVPFGEPDRLQVEQLTSIMGLIVVELLHLKWIWLSEWNCRRCNGPIGLFRARSWPIGLRRRHAQDRDAP